MSPMIAQPGRYPHPHGEPHPDALARQRRDRLARATAQDMESALAFLSMIDPEAFEIALSAATLRADELPRRTLASKHPTGAPSARRGTRPVAPQRR
jgi:hypothetical protein